MLHFWFFKTSYIGRSSIPHGWRNLRSCRFSASSLLALGLLLISHSVSNARVLKPLLLPVTRILRPNVCQWCWMSQFFCKLLHAHHTLQLLRLLLNRGTRYRWSSQTFNRVVSLFLMLLAHFGQTLAWLGAIWSVSFDWYGSIEVLGVDMKAHVQSLFKFAKYFEQVVLPIVAFGSCDGTFLAELVYCEGDA